MRLILELLLLPYQIIINLEPFLSNGNTFNGRIIGHLRGSISNSIEKSQHKYLSSVSNFRKKTINLMRSSRQLFVDDNINITKKNCYHDTNINNYNQSTIAKRLNNFIPAINSDLVHKSLLEFSDTEVIESIKNSTLPPFFNISTTISTISLNTDRGKAVNDIYSISLNSTTRQLSKDVLPSSWLKSLNISMVEVKLSFMFARSEFIEHRFNMNVGSKRKGVIYLDEEGITSDLMRKDIVNIDAESILAGNHPELVTTVLESILVVLCNSSFIHIITTVPTTFFEKKETINSGKFFDFCSKEIIDFATLPYLSNTVLYADIKGPYVQVHQTPSTTIENISNNNYHGTILDGRLSIYDRIEYDLGSNEYDDNSVLTVTELMRWQEWTLNYPILKYSTFSSMNDNYLINPSHLERYISSILFTNIQNGTLDNLLNRGHKNIIASSSIGMERDTFQKVLDELAINLSIIKEAKSNKSTRDIDFTHSIRFFGIILMGCIILAALSLFTMAKRIHRKRKCANVAMQHIKNELVTTEEVEIMSGSSRVDSVEMQEHNSHGYTNELKNRYSRSSTKLTENIDDGIISRSSDFFQSLQIKKKLFSPPILIEDFASLRVR